MFLFADMLLFATVIRSSLTYIDELRIAYPAANRIGALMCSQSFWKL